MAWLTDDDLRTFARDGYLVVRNAVAGHLLATADAEIDRLVVDDPKEGEAEGGVGAASWSSTPSQLPRCRDVLTRSPVLEIARELVEPHEIGLAFDTIQVATTLPPYSHIPGAGHIDGHGPRPGAPASFTMLAGVALTDQSSPQSGALWVWPGSHLGHQDLFQERGTEVLKDAWGHAVWLDPPVHFGARVELDMGRGDLLLAHFLLGHNKGGNAGPTVRRTIYFRLTVPGHPDRWQETFLDAWTEYPPVRAVLT